MQTMPTRDWYANVPRSARGATIAGIVTLFATFLTFGVWANSAPIAGAVVATGVFVTTGSNKTVQHLEGGVIKEIVVREGDHVMPGDTLVILDETAPQAELRRLQLRFARTLAMEARLVAEIEGLPDIAFPDVLLAKAQDPDVAEMIERQRLTFSARKRHLDSEIATLTRGVDALQERVTGNEVQISSVEEQIAFFEEELADKETLLRQGLVRRPEVLAIQRARASMHGEIGRLIGDMGDARERIARGEEQINALRNAAVKAAVEELQQVHAEMSDLRERIRSAENILERIRITAPVEGIVVKLRYHTAGGVIEAGKNVMEIVPIDEPLLIEARVRPRDVDSVRRGQQASVRLTALNQRTTPMVAGEVIYLSADALPEERPGVASEGDLYVVRIALDDASVARIPHFEPTAGMPAEVYIETAERTFFEYLIRPLRDSMARAFRET
ncbi:HlyD family type I secretion periplasmic adaptor subunit [Salinarimonas ramus]|uniref:Membrane fusion protein (MFP) family protein n=2 Tax=Salinarimonas ramus TaxID=690164 RepID=A0A917V572_9HYPH|nr:HlyD family type I secretion periplasmic adaptor subunit [Salinarimonas ramus]